MGNYRNPDEYSNYRKGCAIQIVGNSVFNGLGFLNFSGDIFVSGMTYNQLFATDKMVFLQSCLGLRNLYGGFLTLL